MFKPLSELFDDTSTKMVAGDVRVHAEYLSQKMLKSERVYCVQVRGGVLVMRVGTPALFQELYVQKKAIINAIEKDTGFLVSDIRIAPTYY